MENQMNIYDNLKIRNNYDTFVYNLKPYQYFFTLTFRYNQTENLCVEQVNHFLRLMNNKFFGRKRTTQYLEGFAFAEPHKFFSDRIHYHFLVKPNDQYEIPGKTNFRDYFYRCLEKVKLNQHSTVPAFVKRSIDFQENLYEEENLIHYLTKSFERSADASFIQPLSSVGIARLYW